MGPAEYVESWHTSVSYTYKIHQSKIRVIKRRKTEDTRLDATLLAGHRNCEASGRSSYGSRIAGTGESSVSHEPVRHESSHMIHLPVISEWHRIVQGVNHSSVSRNYVADFPDESWPNGHAEHLQAYFKYSLF